MPEAAREALFQEDAAMKNMRWWLKIVGAAAVVLALVSPTVPAQETGASINGIVHDTTGATVNDATVVAINGATNAQITAQTQSGGEYTLLDLPPGTYTLTVTASGFRGYQQTGILLNLNQHATVDIVLELGNVQQQVTVNADVTGLDTASSELNAEVNGDSIRNLPLNTRESYSLLALVPGFTGSIGNDYNAVSYSIDGGDADYGDILVDGTPAGFPTVNGVQGVGVFPSVDAIGEFRLLSQNIPAEFGRTVDGIVNVVFKSGGNQFHGTGFEFIRTKNMDANDFFSNLHDTPLPNFHRDQFGGVLTGPIYRNKTFFLVSSELLLQNQFQSLTTTVPTLLQRQGDFSQTYGPNGNMIVIYDPYTTTYNAATGQYARTAYTGNKLTSKPSELSKVGFNVLNYYPLPNTTGNAITNANNYYAAGSTKTQSIAWDARVDHTLSDRQKIFGRYSNRYYDSDPGPLFPAAAVPAEGLINGEDFSRGITAGDTLSLTPRTIIDSRLGFARTLYNYLNNSLGFQDSTLGLPSNIDAAPGVTPLFPQMDPAGYDGLGNNGERHNSFMTYDLLSSVTLERGKHIFKIGFDGRMIRVNDNEASYGAGGYTFGANWTQGPNANAASAYAGNGLASMLIGLGTGYVIQDYKNVATQSYYFGEYVQDDWRITPKLTLNLGVRYDLESPRTERFNRMNWFDPNVASPLNTDIAGLTGGLQFVAVGSHSRHQYNVDWNNVGPRFGFAYAATPSTVVHGGLSQLYGQSTQQAAGTVGPYGWRVQTNWVDTLDNVTPYQCPATGTCLGGNLDNPFPQGFTTPPGPADGLWTGAGSLLEGVLRQDATPYSIQWGLDVQQKLPFQMTADVAYVANRGRQLIQSGEGGLDLDQLPVSDLSLGSALNTQVPNPFYGDSRVTGTLAAPTTSKEQLMTKYPQWLEMWPLRAQGGNSQYDALQVTLNKRLSSGLQLQASYAWAKNFWNGTTHQDTFNPMSDYAIASQDIHQRLVVSYIYQLPFGHGRAYGVHIPGWENAVLGGWQTNGITTFQGGNPLAVSGSNTLSSFDFQTLRANTNFQNPSLSGPVKNRYNKYFNTADFSQPPAFTLGAGPAYYNHLRGPGLDNTDFSLFKVFSPVEKLKAEFRAEAFNIFNHPEFSNPNTSVTSTSFGQITSQANSPRQLQFGLKLEF
jgi:hypothetical protein